jgi:ADP-ribose pyrophosphatase YjhB (NUDIX family)
LVSDENRFGHSFTKFPGGGLEWGEGLADGLKREIKEELGLDAAIGELLYVNDFFQKSAFRDNDQLISFYFKVDQIDCYKIPVSNHEIPLTEEGEKFRWVAIRNVDQSMFRFPIDKIVAEEIVSIAT